MPQLTTTTNPTGLKKLAKNLFLVRLNKSNGERSFWLESFDAARSGLDSELALACIAHCGNSEAFFELGLIGTLDTTHKDIRTLATDHPLRFRFIVYRPGEWQLEAFADGVRASEEADEVSSSLVDIEPAELHGPAWKLELPPLQSTEKPVVLVEQRLFLTGPIASRNAWFGCLVMPEVLRQIAAAVADSPAYLQDSNSWASGWLGFFESLRCGIPAEDEEQQDRENWVEAVWTEFSRNPAVRHQLDIAIAEQIGDSES